MPKKDELRKKDVQRLSNALKSNFSPEFGDYIGTHRVFKSDFKLKKFDAIVYHTKSNEPLLFEVDSDIIPTLHSIRKFPNLLPKIMVDAGAVKFMINGADLFRPGIVEFEDFKKDQYITVINLQKAAMCIGKTLHNSNELPDSGKVTKTYHSLNDDLWKFSSSS